MRNRTLGAAIVVSIASLYCIHVQGHMRCKAGGCFQRHGVTGPATMVSIVRPSEAEKAAFCKIHNGYRRELGIGPLQWDDGLVQSALQWAQCLAHENKFYHSGVHGRGENLYWGSSSFGKLYTLAEAAYAWGAEKPMMKGRLFDPNSGAGHYTQIIWKNTQKVGAAVVRRENDFYIVAHYYPAGNWIGQNVY